MISEFENINLDSESQYFKNELTMELVLNDIKPNESGMWIFNKNAYFSKYELYVTILAHQAAEQFGITDIVGLIAVLSGQPFIPTRGKFKGATKGTSVASKYLSKIPGKSPVRLPMVTGIPKIIGGNGLRIAFTKIIGKFVGRAIPIIGWGILTYDVGIIFYNTHIIFNSITNGN